MSNLGLILGYATLNFQDENYWKERLFNLRVSQQRARALGGPTQSQMMSMYGNVLGLYNKDKLHPVAKEEADKHFMAIANLGAQAVQDPTKRAAFISAVPEFIRRYNTIKRDSDQFLALEKDVKDGKSLISQKEYDAWVSTPGAYDLADSFFDIKLFSRNEDGGYSYSPEIRPDDSLSEYADNMAKKKLELRSGKVDVERISKEFPDLISVKNIISKDDVKDIVKEYLSDENKAKYLVYTMYNDVKIGKPSRIIAEAGSEIAENYNLRSMAIDATARGVSAIAPFMDVNTKAFYNIIKQTMAENTILFNRESAFKNEVLPMLSREPGVRTALAEGNIEYIEALPVSKVAKVILKDMADNIKSFIEQYTASKTGRIISYKRAGGGGGASRTTLRYQTSSHVDRSGEFFFVRSDITAAKGGQAVKSNISVETFNYMPVGQMYSGAMDIDLSPLKRVPDIKKQNVMLNIRFDDLSLYAVPIARKAIRLKDGTVILAQSALDINTLARIKSEYPEQYKSAVGAKIYALGITDHDGKKAVLAVPFEDIRNQAYAVYGSAVDKMIREIENNFEQNIYVKPKFINFEKKFDIR